MTTCLWKTAILVGLLAASTQVRADEKLDAPDSSALLEQARIAEPSVLFAEDFEGEIKRDMVLWYAGSNDQPPAKLQSASVTNQQAFSGNRCYKVVIAFEPPKQGNAYVRLPIEIPIWSELTLRWRIRTEKSSSIELHPFHGFSLADAEAGQSGNVAQGIGRKIGEDNGWESWEVTVTNSDEVGQYVEGPTLYLQTGAIQTPTVVTFYVDDIVITGKLPPDWKKLWADTYRYFTVFGEEEKRNNAAVRLTTLNAWQSELQRRYAALPELPKATPLLQEHFRAARQKVRDSLDAAAPLVEQIARGLADEKARFSTDVHSAERLLMESRYYLAIAEGYAPYAAQSTESDILTFACDITQSYAILPDGPQAHRMEQSYYGWTQSEDSFENPQLLPDGKPIPAIPSRRLSNFGARRLFVPYSFALHTSRRLEELTFTATSLQSDQDSIPASAVDLRVVAPWYRPWGGKLRLMNEPLLHDPEFVVPVPEKAENQFKDRKYGSDADRLLPLTLPANTTRQFYALVEIPAAAKAGVYRGTIAATAKDGTTVAWELELEVLPFDLEPTPNAYSAFYRSYLRDDEYKKHEGIHSSYKSAAQMEAELVNMARHGMNTLNLYDGAPVKTEKGWDFSELDKRLAMARRAGLTRSPFTWLGHNVPFVPDARYPDIDTWEKVNAAIVDRVAAVKEFCKGKGYPQPAFFGHDERSGAELAALKPGYQAVNDAGGIVTCAVYSDYWSNAGKAMTLPILFGGVSSSSTERIVRASQDAGGEVWIYNCPTTNMAASPSVYRRRYGLSMWKNGENGAAPWEYSGVHNTQEGYVFEPDKPVYAFAFPTWNGRPIDSIIFEAYREGIYDTRYMATLENALAAAKQSEKAPALVAEVEAWLKSFSVHEDLGRVRRQMADYTIALIQVKN